MENIIRLLQHRLRELLAPPSPVRDLLDHPELRHFSAHELDDLPLPRPEARTCCG